MNIYCNLCYSRIVRIPGAYDAMHLAELLIEGNFTFILNPLTPSQFTTVNEISDTAFLNVSNTLDVKYDGYIISEPRPGQRDIFEFLNGFQIQVWITLLLTIFFIPLALALVKKKFSDYFTDLWNYSYLILTEVIPRIPKPSMQRFVITFWLLGCVVLLAGFGGVLRDYFIKKTPDVVIDSWEDLHNRKELTIVVTEGSVIHDFAQKEFKNNEMAKDFKSRMRTHYVINYNNTENLIQNLKQADVAFSVPYQLLDDCAYFARRYNIPFECKNLHISKYGGITAPYFIPISKNANPRIAKDLNKM